MKPSRSLRRTAYPWNEKSVPQFLERLIGPWEFTMDFLFPNTPNQYHNDRM